MQETWRAFAGEMEDAVRAYIDLFCGDTQPAELRALRLLALAWMERMAPFRPHLCGAVWHGTATHLSDITIQMFCDDSKSAEIALIDHRVPYTPATVTGFRGEPVEALSFAILDVELGTTVGVHLMVYDLDDLRVNASKKLSWLLRHGAAEAGIVLHACPAC